MSEFSYHALMKAICRPCVFALLSALVTHAQTLTTTPPAVAAPAATAVAGGSTAAEAHDEPSTAKRLDPAASEREKPLRLPRLEKPPVIDGRLDDEAWKDALRVGEFYQVQPGDNIAPSKPTEVVLGYDDHNLYVGFLAYDEPDKVRATVAKRDAIFSDDNVRILLDTFNDKRKAYILAFNPLGVQADGILTEGRGEDYSVDLVLDSKGMLTKNGYVVEAAIPFKSLRFEAGEGKPWGVHVFRRIKRLNNELDSWTPISRDKSGTLNQARRVTGLENISAGRTIEIIPSVTLSESGKRVRTLSPAAAVHDPGRFVNEPLNAELGVTAKLGLTPNTTLDFAINPDFAQVEADQIVVTANQRFPIFFQEKRPFFLEGIDIFQTPLDAVYTRAIVDPDYAVKLSGKRGRNSFGFLVASDNAPGNYQGDERLDPRNARFLDKNAFIGVLRLKRDIGKESSIGLIATSYDFIDKHNHLGGIDGRFRFNPQTFFNFQVLGTTSRRLFRDADLGRNVYRTGNGFAYSWSFDKVGRNLSYNLSGQGRTRDYRADVGFTPRTNNNSEKLFAIYASDPDPKARLISWRISNSVSSNFDWQGRLQRWDVQPMLGFTLPKQTSLQFGLRGGYERVFEEEFGVKRTPTRRGAFAGEDSERSTYKKSIIVSGETTPSKKYSAFFLVAYEMGVFDFDLGAGPRFPRVSPATLLNRNAPRDPGSANALTINAIFTYQPTAAFSTTFDYTKARMLRHDTGLLAFDDDIYALRATYQFTRSTFLRARVDYDMLAANMRGQFLLGWSPSPGTSLYAGYNDDVNYNGFNPFTGQHEPGFNRNGRNFFIKLSYLFRRDL